MNAFPVLLRIVHVAGTAGIGLVLWFSGVYGHEEVTGSQDGWPKDVDAWQWDGLLVLAVVSVGAGAVFAIRPTAVALALHAAVSGAGVVLVVDAGVVSAEQLVLGWLATVSAGAGLVAQRRGASRL